MVLMLAVNVNERTADLAENIELGKCAGDVHPILARSAQDAFDDQIVVELETGSAQPLLQFRGQIFEQCFDACIVFAMPDHFGADAVAAYEAEGVQDDRFAGARLTRNHVQTALQLQSDFVDDRKISDSELAQHTENLTFTPFELCA